MLLTVAAAAEDRKEVPEGAQVPHHFEIPSQPLAAALMRFGEQSGLMILVPSSLTQGKTSRAVRGELPPQQALEALLQGSRVEFTWAADDVVAFSAATEPASSDSQPLTGPRAARRPSSLPQPEVAQDSEPLSEVVVTGSLIQEPGLAKATPVLSIDSQEIVLRQSNVAEELLRALPGAVPGIGAEVTNSTYGASTVNLRGLGQNRNLVLLDGARLTPWGLDGSVDLNDIPLALVERVEVLTGGASTTYGADAVAGVVNFITRHHFSGAEVETSEQINQRGDGNTVRTDLILGRNFGAGRGNGVLSLSYQDSHGLDTSDRAFSARTINSYTGAEGTSPATVPGEFSLPGSGVLQLNTATGTLVPTYGREDSGAFGTLQTPFKRFEVYASGDYSINDQAEVYGQALYSKYTVDSPYAPTQTSGALVNIPYSNPYLPAGVRAQFCSANGLTVAQCAAAATAVSPSDPNYATFQTDVFRSILEAGRTGLEFDTDLRQIRAGLRGHVTPQLRFDLFGTYGQGDNLQMLTGNGRYSRLQQALLATDPNGCLDTANHCVPLDLFGNEGSVTPAQVAFLTGGPTYLRTTTSLGTLHATLDGTLDLKSPLAVTPVGVALGGEYRKYAVDTAPDQPSQTPGELLDESPIPQFYGAYTVREAFTEVIAPLLEGRAFADRVTLELGGRISDYSTAGTSFTWKTGASWAPVEHLQLRGMLQVAERAPNIGELFTPLVYTYNSIAADPCAGPGVTPNSNLGRICIAQGAPASSLGTITTPSAANVTTGGNPHLGVEKARSYTGGAVFQPGAPGNTVISADYYHILITNAITVPTVTDVLNECFATSNNPALAVTSACTQIRRNPVTGNLYGDQATTPGVPILLTNQGLLATDGLDWSINQRIPMPVGKLLLGLQGNWTRSATFKATPSALNRQCAGYYSVNCTSVQPKLSWTQRSTFQVRDWELSLLWRFLSSERYEPQALSDTTQAPLAQYQHIPAYSYFDLTSQWHATGHLRISMLVQNLFDKQPPFVGSTIGYLIYNTANTYPSTYDIQGRRFGLTFNYQF